MKRCFFFIAFGAILSSTLIFSPVAATGTASGSAWRIGANADYNRGGSHAILKDINRDARACNFNVLDIAFQDDIPLVAGQRQAEQHQFVGVRNFCVEGGQDVAPQNSFAGKATVRSGKVALHCKTALPESFSPLRNVGDASDLMNPATGKIAVWCTLATVHPEVDTLAVRAPPSIVVESCHHSSGFVFPHINYSHLAIVSVAFRPSSADLLRATMFKSGYIRAPPMVLLHSC
ncbi:MAG: hypothetical protein P4L55_07560 [Syntrophobacteraceae bacterium]|nr:hypothetical protein [Syntrophobacteraceae bacterium]